MGNVTGWFIVEIYWNITSHGTCLSQFTCHTCRWRGGLSCCCCCCAGCSSGRYPGAATTIINLSLLTSLYFSQLACLLSLHWLELQRQKHTTICDTLSSNIIKLQFVCINFPALWGGCAGQWDRWPQLPGHHTSSSYTHQHTQQQNPPSRIPKSPLKNKNSSLFGRSHAGDLEGCQWFWN